MRELKFIEHSKKDLFQMVEIYVWCWMHIMKYTAFLQFERETDQAKSKKLAYS
jgi:hypothetical protein